MSLTAWHTHLVERIATLATPLSRAPALGPSFVFDRAVGGERASGARRFNIAVTGAAPFGPSRPGGVWIRLACVLRCDYLDQPTDQAGLTLAMAEDAAVISDVLCASANWSPSTTCIRRVGGENANDLTVAEMVPVLGGQRLLLRFPVEVTRV